MHVIAHVSFDHCSLFSLVFNTRPPYSIPPPSPTQSHSLSLSLNLSEAMSTFRAPAGAATVFTADQKIRLGRLDALRSSHSFFLGRYGRGGVSVPPSASSSSSSPIQAVSTVRFDICYFLLNNHKEDSAYGCENS